MNSKVVIYLVSIAILAIVQSIFTKYIRYDGVVPDFMLVFVISSALLSGVGEGALVGLVIGFALDMLSAKVLGLNALIFMYFGMIVGTFNRKLYRESAITALMFVATATFIYNFYVVIAMFWLRGNPVSWNVFLKISFIEMLYNSILTFIIHPVVIRMNNWIDTYKNVFKRY